jgi:murein DD-endopeptidase MepM/ murein hydrolase activator NlpD
VQARGFAGTWLGATAALAACAGGAAASGGGATYVASPKVSKVSCIRRCASRHRARPGSTLKLTGSELGGARRAVFHGSRGGADDVVAGVRAGGSTRLNVRVPLGAVTGPISVRVSRTVGSPRTKPVPILPPPPPSPNPTLSPVPGPRDGGAPQLETGTSRTKVFYGARRAVVFSYRLSAPSKVQVQLVSAADGTVARTWSPGPVAAGTVQSVAWSGSLGRSPARPGRYLFRLTAQGSSGAVARSSSSTDVLRDAFDLYPNEFPVRGRHDFGGPDARFGAGRSGHSHQGQDVMARCGTRLVAARGGRVSHKAYHSAAGYYVVIDAAGTNVDYTYMHLAEPTPFSAGDRVYTGQRIGSVGDTGNAEGCHLHFELWRGPWYGGGSPFDPLPSLQAWDGWS